MHFVSAGSGNATRCIGGASRRGLRVKICSCRSCCEQQVYYLNPNLSGASAAMVVHVRTNAADAHHRLSRKILVYFTLTKNITGLAHHREGARVMGHAGSVRVLRGFRPVTPSFPWQARVTPMPNHLK